MALSVAVQVRGLDEARATIRALPAASQAAASRMAFRAGAVVERLWKLHLSGPGGARNLNVRSGNLRNSIRMERIGPAAVVVGTHLPYGAIHEFGGVTRAHEIRPRHGKALRFRVGGEFVFAKVVRHPGSRIPARPHRAPALRDAESPMGAIFSGEMDRALREADLAGERITTASRERQGGS